MTFSRKKMYFQLSKTAQTLKKVITQKVLKTKLKQGKHKKALIN